MNAGKMDKRIRIERPTVATDPDYGPQVSAWVPLSTVWAEVQDVLPSRAESQGQGIRIANRPARVRIRYLPGLTSDMRIVLVNQGGRVMQIVSGPAEIGRREGMEFMAEEYSTVGGPA